jgi:cytidylate kinase
MDGRDIGTVVFPNADYKFFVTASPEVRAQRRYDELIAKEGHANYDEILENLKQRDFIDTTRAESPLRQADDAILVDTSNMTREGQLEWILSKIQ